MLFVSRAIDKLNDTIATAVSWALLLAVLICAGNALIRYSLNMSSNAWLEIQWYLFAAVFMLASPHTLRRDEHVRIDVVTGRFSRRTQVWLDLLGFVFFLMPVCLVILYYGIPFGLESLRSGEMSSNSGGLIVWPAKLLVAVGFALMILQGVSEMIKRVAYLQGRLDASAFTKHAVTPEEEIAAIKNANHLT
ncbi:TRAP transporter small permease subunit [Pseudoduganella buxea]|uniref:TRAP transporter small permease protein n=1 Tax=Pseudoduganella buxea TaxID=1949069 RepID=A0A6I3SWA3_9BURK|nr:TRAP transporter small permease subunit [Pseudoduganella buxea]MTV52027.1 TRAP transporter small permease subunit [Pseudoduganella buxea]GGB98071.1 C4-dicarboxylate ABC transporter [Pseudoduganella buxea]